MDKNWREKLQSSQRLKVFEVPLNGQIYSSTRVKTGGLEILTFSLSQTGHFFFSSKSILIKRVLHPDLLFKDFSLATLGTSLRLRLLNPSHAIRTSFTQYFISFSISFAQLVVDAQNIYNSLYGQEKAL